MWENLVIYCLCLLIIDGLWKVMVWDVVWVILKFMKRIVKVVSKNMIDVILFFEDGENRRKSCIFFCCCLWLLVLYCGEEVRMEGRVFIDLGLNSEI